MDGLKGILSFNNSLSGNLSKANKLSGVISDKKIFSGSLSNQILRGFSNYDLAVMSGYEGTLEEFLESLKGKSVEIEVIESENGFFLKFISASGETVSPEIYTNNYASITLDQIDEILDGGGSIE